MQISKRQLDALHKKVADAEARRTAAYAGADLRAVNLQEQIRLRDEAIVQLSLRLSAYGDPGGPAIALAS
jgi:hypothetical protein